MKHELPDLPYPKNSLEPYMSSETLKFHHDRHHRGYVDKLNKLIQGTEFENLGLVDIVTKAGSGPIFNNAAQVWNHTFFWHCLGPRMRPPKGPLRDTIERDFGSMDELHKQFNHKAADLFGSGWVWLVRSEPEGKLLIESTSNAENPLRAGRTPILTCDVWEHAYYIDYRNERSVYLEAIWNILNWDFAEHNFSSTWEQAA